MLKSPSTTFESVTPEQLRDEPMRELTKIWVGNRASFLKVMNAHSPWRAKAPVFPYFGLHGTNLKGIKAIERARFFQRGDVTTFTDRDTATTKDLIALLMQMPQTPINYMRNNPNVPSAPGGIVVINLEDNGRNWSNIIESRMSIGELRTITPLTSLGRYYSGFQNPDYSVMRAGCGYINTSGGTRFKGIIRSTELPIYSGIEFDPEKMEGLARSIFGTLFLNQEVLKRSLQLMEIIE
ncbi:MAG: hypothetical protein WC897_04025 [Candidatus Gracilibacteria bacterium]